MPDSRPATAPLARAPWHHSGTLGGRIWTVLRAPLTGRAWAEAAYCLIGFPLGLAGFVVLVILLVLGAR